MSYRPLIVAAVWAATVACDGGGSVGPDGGPLADADTDCETVPQSGCAGDDKCAFVLEDMSSGDGIEACARSGPAALGMACVPPQEVGEADNCEKGAHCYLSECQKMCDGRTVGCDSSSSCVGFDRFSFGLCLPKCDLLAQNCPDLGTDEAQGCYLTPNGSVCAAVVGGAGKPAGSTCSFQNECEPGAGCFAIGGAERLCYAFCDGGPFGGSDPEHCQAGQVCSPPLPGTTVGLCF